MNDDTISRAEALKALEWKWAGKAAIDAIRELPIPCCSVCNNFMAFRWRFCPNCGAKMEEKDNE